MVKLIKRSREGENLFLYKIEHIKGEFYFMKFLLNLCFTIIWPFYLNFQKSFLIKMRGKLKKSKFLKISAILLTL